MKVEEPLQDSRVHVVWNRCFCTCTAETDLPEGSDVYHHVAPAVHRPRNSLTGRGRPGLQPPACSPRPVPSPWGSSSGISHTAASPGSPPRTSCWCSSYSPGCRDDGAQRRFGSGLVAGTVFAAAGVAIELRGTPRAWNWAGSAIAFGSLGCSWSLRTGPSTPTPSPPPQRWWR